MQCIEISANVDITIAEWNKKMTAKYCTQTIQHHE